MDTKQALVVGAVAFATFAHAAGAKAQVEPTVQACKELSSLVAAWQNFETQDVNASLEEVREVAREVSAALDQAAGEARSSSPAAFAQLKETHSVVEAELAAVPEEATPEQIQDRIAIAKENERFAYQNLMGNIVCP